MDAPSDPPGECLAPQDLLSALPPDLLRRILQAVEGDAPQDFREEKCPLAALLLVCKGLSEGARGSITRLHFAVTKHSPFILIYPSPQFQHQLQCLSFCTGKSSDVVERQLELLAQHLPNLNKLALKWSHRRCTPPSVRALGNLPRLTQLSLSFSPRSGLASLSMLEELSLWDSRSIYLSELPPSLHTLRLGVARKQALPDELCITPGPSGFPLLRTAEIRNRYFWNARTAASFLLSSLTALTLTEMAKLPPLSALTKLETLVVRNCPLLKLDLRAFQGLESLQVLKLQSLPVSPGFPMGFSLPSLRQLILSEAGFATMMFSDEFPMLEELVVDRVKAVGGVISLGGQASFKSLRIVKSYVRCVCLVGDMPLLEEVYFERLRATKVVEVPPAPSLRSVYVSNLPLRVLPDSGLEYPALEKLHLEGLRKLDTEFITALQVPPALFSLTLVDLPSELLPSLRGCTRLEELRLRALKPWCGPADAETCPFDDSDLPNSVLRLEVLDVRVCKQAVGHGGPH